MSASMRNTAAELPEIAVVAGIIRRDGRILIARRPDDRHMGGLWEFPGGKQEAGESAYAALCRELQEELGIAVQQAEPFMVIRHEYPGKRVVLDFWQVTAFAGEPHGREGQPVSWVECDRLGEYAFPPANVPVVNALLVAGGTASTR